MDKHPYEMKMIKAKEIRVNRLYQREEKTPVIRKIIKCFDYHLVNPPKLVCRDGEYYAWDGQQTTVALRTLFGDNYLIPCMIYYDVPSWVDEAILFESANGKDFRKPVSDTELFISRLNRSEPIALSIKQICERNNFKLALENRAGGNKIICAISALDAIYKKFGEDVFAETIGNLAMAWNGDERSVQSPMLRGMAQFVNKYKGEYDRAKLVKCLHQYYTAGEILRAAKARIEGGTTKYAQEILSAYNKHTMNKLPYKF